MAAAFKKLYIDGTIYRLKASHSLEVRRIIEVTVEKPCTASLQRNSAYICAWASLDCVQNTVFPKP